MCSAVVESSERTENFKSFLLDGNEDVGSCAVVAHFRTLRDALAEKRFSHSQLGIFSRTKLNLHNNAFAMKIHSINKP